MGVVQLSWPEADAEATYLVYRSASPIDPDAPGSPIETTTSLGFIDDEAPDGTNYYRVQASWGDPLQVAWSRNRTVTVGAVIDEKIFQSFSDELEGSVRDGILLSGDEQDDGSDRLIL